MACVSAVVDVTDDCSTVSVQLFTVLVSVVALHRNDHINQSVLTHHCISVGSRLPCRPNISVSVVNGWMRFMDVKRSLCYVFWLRFECLTSF